SPEVLSGLKIKEGSKVEFKLARKNGSDAPELGALTGEGYPIYEVSIYVDGLPIHRLGGTITVAIDGKGLSETGGLHLIHALHNGAYEDVFYTRSNEQLLFKLDSLSYVLLVDDAKAAGFLRNPFADVAETDWFYDNVLYAYQTGLMVGTDSDSFSPKTPVTRAMAITVLHRINGDAASYDNKFMDIPKGSWYANAAAWAANNAIAAGTGANRFAPNAQITREQLAVLLYNYAKQEGYDVTTYKELDLKLYQDAGRISDYAYTALQWACGTGIIKGDSSGNLKPQGSANRAEVSAMVQRFDENIAE
ncbi:MAG: S-layer homology domain-containing protein, partial [Eubacteriales bacterium]|nr:S-layer homology domain-containing protein [Eubacteriales bacterium]